MASTAEVYDSYTESSSHKADDEKTLTGAQLRTRATDAYRAQSDWRASVVDNLKMLNNDQWPDDLKARLAEQNMNPIVINKMLMPLMFLSGVQRQTREEPKLLPFEGGDAKSSEIMNALLHWIEEQTYAEEQDSRVFLDKTAIGLGWWKVTWDYDTEEPEGRLRKERRHMLSVFPDPNWFDSGNWDDAEYVFDALWMTPAEAAARWPDHADTFSREPGEWLQATEGNAMGAGGGAAITGDAFFSERLFWDPLTKRVRILEGWYKERKKVTLAINQTTLEVISDPQLVKRMQQLAPQLPPREQGNMLFITRAIPRVRVCHLFHDEILDQEDSPHDTPTFPLFPSLGYYFWKNPLGLADLMKDLQREKNKRRSKIIEMVGRMPNSGYFNHETEGADPKQIEEYGSGNGLVISYKAKEPTQIKPPDLPMAVTSLEDKADDEIKEVTNIHDELLGQATQQTISGKAIEARQRGGMVSHESLFDTFRQEKTRVIKFEINLIKQHLSPSAALRILGTLAQRQQNSPMGQMMQQAQDNPLEADAVMTALSTAFDIEYDVVISARPAEPSLMMQAWETLSDLKQKGVEIPPKTLFEAAQRAGILSEDQVKEILAFIQQQQQAAMGPVPGMPPGGPEPQGSPGQGPPTPAPSPAPPPGP